MREFEREAKVERDKEYLARRFESLLKTVAETKDVGLKISAEGAKTDGKTVVLTDPQVFYNMGFKPDEAIDLAIHCVIHEAAHVRYSGTPSDFLEPAYEKYVPQGYDWKKLFMNIDMLEDIRVNTLNEQVRPGTTSHRVNAAKLLLSKAHKGVDPVEIGLMTEFFAEQAPSVPKKLKAKYEAAKAVVEDFMANGTGTQSAVDYGVKLYDIMHDKAEDSEGKGDGEGEGKAKDKDECKGKDKEKSGKGKGKKGEREEQGEKEDGDNSESDVENEGEEETTEPDDEDTEGDDNEDGNGESSEDGGDEQGEGEGSDDGDGESSEGKGKPTEAKPSVKAPKGMGFSSKPAVMADSKVGDDVDKMKLPETTTGGAKRSNMLPGTIYPYADSDVKGARIINDMAREGRHKHIKVGYVKLDPCKHLHSDLQRAENSIRTLISKAKNYLKLDSRQDLPGRRSGKLIGSQVWRAVSDIKDTRVFSKPLDSSHGDTAVYILVDASGSMSGSKEDQARVAVYTLARMMVAYNIPCKVVSFDVSYESIGDCVRHVEYKDWTEKDCSKISYFEAMHDNRDGMDLHIASLELAQRPERNKILFVLSDGSPCDGTSPGEVYYDIKDVAHYRQKAQRMGQKVLGVYMSPDIDKRPAESLAESVAEHKLMYGDELYAVGSIEQIPSMLLRALARFTR